MSSYTFLKIRYEFVLIITVPANDGKALETFLLEPVDEAQEPLLPPLPQDRLLSAQPRRHIHQLLLKGVVEVQREAFHQLLACQDVDGTAAAQKRQDVVGQQNGLQVVAQLCAT